MIWPFRPRFNAAWSHGQYERLMQILEGQVGPIPFRIAETPCFLETAFANRLACDGAELIRQLTTPEYRALSDTSIPPAFRAPNENPYPLFVQVDFGLERDESGTIVPRLVEIQGFPSLYAFQFTLAYAYREAYGLPPELSCFLPPYTITTYIELLTNAIVGSHSPENVVLLEIDPDHQKTACDFVMTQKWLGVQAVCLTKIRKRGRKLFYDREGVETPIHRIYNRVIIDEQLRRGVTAPFDWRDELDVEWAGHPNYYFRISKFSLPHLQHPSVPHTQFLHNLPIPPDLDNWVLKPLYSFAGTGVQAGPTQAEIQAIPFAERDQWILQRRCDFTPLIETPAGPTKLEIRVMYIWDEGPRAVSTLIRMGRGQQMGVNFNKDLSWVGASAGLIQTA